MTFLSDWRRSEAEHIPISAKRKTAEGKNIARMPEIAAATMIRPIKNTFLLLVRFLFTLSGALVLSFLPFISSSEHGLLKST
jgi:hypothetical protein